MFRWIRRSDHTGRPNAMTCCFFSSFKTLLTLTEGIALASKSMSGTLLIVGRFSGDHVWPVLGVHRGPACHRLASTLRPCRGLYRVLDLATTSRLRRYYTRRGGSGYDSTANEAYTEVSPDTYYLCSNGDRAERY